ncbi:hypothetical protein H8S90_17365 [Olivibacter sp. SDN3]|uniref:hypothetical protein n=1 Tax=Olivibacter sp. SDN3 TaxID=2764720 RepID=UPI001651A567|nr:hypothetical protein [Olivibacter sp. SDN3]QNL48545.1 hypothetical protein H8S90_17365 [Olivibacter sp. SDN3]
MKTTHHFNFAIAVCFTTLFAACQQQAQRPSHANWADSSFIDKDSTTNPSEDGYIDQQYCFLNLSGNRKTQDSSYVSLTINGEKVSGNHHWSPFEKDGRAGTINGLKRGDTLDVVWSFMQEGMQDTLRTVFLLKGDILKQKPYSVDQQVGRQVTDNQSDFSIIYKKVSCEDL